MENQIEIVRTKNNQTEIQVLFEKETVWFNINHLKNRSKSDEL